MRGLVTAENKKWWTLAAVSVGLFMIMLDNTVVNVALPRMQSSLHMQLSQLEWVVTGYALTFAAFIGVPVENAGPLRGQLDRIERSFAPDPVR